MLLPMLVLPLLELVLEDQGVTEDLVDTEVVLVQEDIHRPVRDQPRELAIHREDHWPMHDPEMDAPREVDRSVHSRAISTRQF